MENNYKKYIKYKLKYLNLLSQSGGLKIKYIDGSKIITYKKDEGDIIYELKNIKYVIVDKPPNVDSHYKHYIIRHNDELSTDTNFAELQKLKLQDTSINKSGFDITISGQHIEILDKLEKLKEDSLDFFDKDIASINYRKLNALITQNYENYPKEPPTLILESSAPVIPHVSRSKLGYSHSSYLWNQLIPLKSLPKPGTDKNVDYVIEHIKLKFRELAFILEKDPTIKIVIPGNINNRTGRWEHTLAKGINDVKALAKGWWENDILYDKMLAIIEKLIVQFRAIYESNITLGWIGNTLTYNKDDISKITLNGTVHKAREKDEPEFQGKSNEKLIHVWGANYDNYNNGDNERIGGDGQASYFPIQKPGVFGIITVNVSNPIKILRDRSNYLTNYFKEYVEEFYNELPDIYR